MPLSLSLSLSLSISVYFVPTLTHVHHHQECCLHYRTDGLVLNTLVKSTWASYASRGLTFLHRMHRSENQNSRLKLIALRPPPRSIPPSVSFPSFYSSRRGRGTLHQSVITTVAFDRDPPLDLLPYSSLLVRPSST